MKKVLFGLTCCGLLSSAMASNYYVGGDVGYSDTHYTSTQLGANNGSTGVGFRLYGGYDINQHFSMELGAENYAKASGDAVSAAEEHAYDVSAVGRYPIGNAGLSIFGKLGLAYMMAQKDFSGVGHAYANVIRPAYGFGVASTLTPRLSVTMQWWRIQGKSNAYNGIDVDTKLPNADLYTVGLLYRFI